MAEVAATLAIAAMIMAAVIGIYTGVRRAEQSINRRLEDGFLPMEILQRIAEDVDRLVQDQTDVKVTIKNKTEEGGYKSAQMVIESKIYDKNNKPQVFDRVVWQSRADLDEDGMILYRSHSGYAVEDKMLDEPKEEYERKWYIPVCSGETLFNIQAVNGENIVDKWDSDKLPAGVKVSLSFEVPVKDVLGDYTVPEEGIYTGTTTTDRFKQLTYQFVKVELPDINDISDYNNIDANEPNNSEFEDANNTAVSR